MPLKLRSCFEIAEIAGESLIIPQGEVAASFHGIIALNEASGFLLKLMSIDRTLDELVDCLVDEYDVDRFTALSDVQNLLTYLAGYNIIEQ